MLLPNNEGCNMTTSVLFELVRSAVLDQEPQIEENIVVDWDNLMDESVEQGAIAWVWDGISKLPQHRQPPRQQKISWMLSAQEIWDRHDHQLAVLQELLCVCEKNNIRLLLLKGIGLANLYPSPHSRPSGDLDVFFFDDYDKATRLFCPGQSVLNGKHDSFDYKGVHVENHHTVLDTDTPFRLKIQNYIASRYSLAQMTSNGYYQFDPLTNFIYLVAHTVRHYDSNRGLPLRNIVDLGMYIYKNRCNISPNECLPVLEQLNLSEPFEVLLYFIEWTLNLNFEEYHAGLIKEKDLKVIKSLYFEEGLNNKISSDLPYLKWFWHQWHRYIKVLHLKKYLYRGTDNYLKQVVTIILSYSVRKIFAIPDDSHVFEYFRVRIGKGHAS